MAYVGGKWTLPEGILPGARINVVSKDRASAKTSERGIVAVPMALDWGCDDEIAVFEPSDYTRDALQTFGYEIGSEEIKNIGELFCGATKVVLARLNGKGEKATSEVGVAKYPGTRGNDLAVTIEGDPDMGTEENPLSKVNVSFSSTDNKVTALVDNLPEGYKPNLKATKEDVEVSGDVTVDNNKATIAFDNKVEAGEYKITCSIEKGSVSYKMSVATVNISITEATESKIKLTKGTEQAGDDEEVESELSTANVTFEISENTFKASWTDVAEFTFSTKILKGEKEYSESSVSKSSEKNSVTYTFAKNAPIGEDWKVEVHANKDKDVMVKSCTATAAVEGEDKDAAAKADYQSAEAEEFESEIPVRFIITTYLDGVEVDVQKNKTLENIKDNNFVIWDRTKPLKEAGGVLFSGGTNSEITTESYSEALNKFESQIFHILACPSDDEDIKQMYISFTQENRDSGNYFQVVTSKTEKTANSEAVIQVENRALDAKHPDSDLVYWVAGQEAGCELNQTVANVEYDGCYKIDLSNTQRELENNVLDGYFMFHQARGIDRNQYCKTLLDINTLTDYSDTQDPCWSNNATIRVSDEACNYIAALFNNNYFGRVKNNQAGREQFKNDLLQYFESLETQGAIDAFDKDSIEVIPAEDPRAIIVVAAFTPMNSLEQMYMTLIIE